MSCSLTLDCQLNGDRLAVTNHPQLVYLLLETGVVNAAAHSAPPPVDLALVVDASNSMHIRLVTEAQFVELASMGLVQEVMTDGVPAWRVQDIPSSLIQRFPRKIDYTVEALRTVLEQLNAQDRFALVVFASEASTLIPNTAGRDKRRLLDAIAGLDKIALGDDTYMGRGIALGYQELQSDSEHVSRMVILTDGYTRDAADCWNWVERLRQGGVTVSTMGLGAEFNEELLIPMAEQTGGNAYFIQDASQMPDVFRQELSAVQAVACRNLEVKLLLTPGVELRRAYRVRPVLGGLDPGPNQGGSYTLFLGDLMRGEPPALMLELIIPSWPAGRFRLAQALLSSDPVGQERETVRQDVVVEMAPDAGQASGRVMNLVERVSAFKLQTRALEDVASGDTAGATQKLQAAATRLLDMGEAKLAQTVQQQADALAQGGQLDAGATKKLRYETRKLTQKLD